MSKKNYTGTFLSYPWNMGLLGGGNGIKILVQTLNTQTQGHSSMQLLKNYKQHVFVMCLSNIL